MSVPQEFHGLNIVCVCMCETGLSMCWVSSVCVMLAFSFFFVGYSVTFKICSAALLGEGISGISHLCILYTALVCEL